MTKTFLKKLYVKSYSSVWTKTIFNVMPIISSCIGPIIYNEQIKEIFSYINDFRYDTEKKFSDGNNLNYIALNIFNLSILSQSIHCLKNFISKCQQDTNKIINIKINGDEQEIIAKGKLPLSTYLGDLFMIGGTAYYFKTFKTNDVATKIASLACGILGTIICRSIADDTIYEINNQTSNGINNSVINSNNTVNNIYNINNDGILDNDIQMALLALVGIYKTSDMLINDSTPGQYQYKFYNSSGRELQMSMEWDQDGNYHIFDSYGREIEVI